MKYMSWSYPQLLDCPPAHISEILEMIQEEQAAMEDTGRT